MVVKSMRTIQLKLFNTELKLEIIKSNSLFHLYISPFDSQESDGGAIHRENSYLDLLPEVPRYCNPLQIFGLFF